MTDNHSKTRTNRFINRNTIPKLTDDIKPKNQILELKKHIKKIENTSSKVDEALDSEQETTSDEAVAKVVFDGGKRTLTTVKSKVALKREQQRAIKNESQSKQFINRDKGTRDWREVSIDKKKLQKKQYQKNYHYKKSNSIELVDSAGENSKSKLIQQLAKGLQKIGGAIAKTLSSKVFIIGGIVVVLLSLLYSLLVMALGILSSGSDSTYLFTAAQATYIEEQFSKKELAYLEMILEEADKMRGDFHTTINYDPVGHNPHEILALFNVLFLYDLSVSNEETYDFNTQKINTIIDQLMDARYTFEKDVEAVTRTITVENEDGTTSEEQVTTTVTWLRSTTTSISNIIGGASYNAPANTAAFIQSIGEEAREIAASNDIYASVMIAQAILETGSGGSDLGKPPYFNLFGIKGSYNGDSVTMYTKEDDGTGYMYTISDRFRDYPSYKESLLDYAIVMREQPSPGFYAPTYKSNTNSYREATAYLTGTYATDTQYGSKLNRIIEEYGLTKFDTKSNNNSSDNTEGTKKDIEKSLSGNLFSLTEYEQDVYKRTLELRGLMSGYDSPFENFDWSANIKEPYGYSWNKDSKEIYETDGLLIDTGSGRNVRSQITGKVIKVDNKKGLVAVQSEGTVTFEYSNLKNILVTKDQVIRKGDVVGQTSESGLRLRAFNEKLLELNPQIIMYSETLKSFMHTADITTMNTGTSLSGNNQLNQNMAGKSYDDIDVQNLFNIAKKYIGYPYVFGGASPSTSFDCSGFIYWVYKEAGLKNWGRTTANEMYYKHSAPISEAEARPGDLIFFKNTYNAGVPFTHVGIYAGDGTMLHAGSPIGFASYKTSYWQSHEPTFGRLTQD